MLYGLESTFFRCALQVFTKGKTQSALQISVQVLQWMEDAGIQPSNGMFVDIVSFSQKGCGAEYADKIQERLGKLKLFLVCGTLF